MGLFYVTSFVELNIINSTFEDNYSLGKGSIVFAENKFSKAIISESQFLNNYAYHGGLFFLSYEAEIIALNCSFKNNFAVNGGILFL